DGELAGGEAVARDVRLAVREHGGVRAREHGPQLEGELLALAPFGRSAGARPGVSFAHESRILVLSGTCQAVSARAAPGHGVQGSAGAGERMPGRLRSMRRHRKRLSTTRKLIPGPRPRPRPAPNRRFRHNAWNGNG